MEESKEKRIKHKNPFVDESAFEQDESTKPTEDEILMAEAKRNTTVVEVKTYMMHGIVIGLVAGALLGTLLFGRMQMGMGIGMLIGVIVGLCIHKKPTTEE